MRGRFFFTCGGPMSVIRMLAIGFCLAMGIAAAGATADEPGWRSLFNGRDLEGWQPTPFGGNGEVRVVDGAIHVAVGSELSGITWQRDIPRTNIEIAIEARRDEGFDFFCGLTFPVGEGSCSFIVGGWGGTVVGLSSIDGLDASQNATTTSEIFTSGQWYRIRVRSMPDRIECYIDDKRVVDQTVADHQFMVRDEMLPARPLGIATYATAASLRDLRWRVIDPP